MTLPGISPLRRPFLEPAAVRRVIVFRALHLGDILCAVPALRELDRLYPAAEITLVGLPWTRAIIDRFPYVDRFLDFPGYWGLEGVPWDSTRTAAFVREAACHSYDLSIQMHGDGSISNSFVAQLGARVSVGYGRGRRQSGQALSLEIPYPAKEHEIQRCLGLVQAVGGTGEPTLEFPIFPADQRDLDSILLTAGVGAMRPIVVVHPGASAPEKRWPPEKFAAAADRIALRTNADVAITGTSGEIDVALDVACRMSTRPVVLAGKTSIATLAALIERAALVITNDSGPAHLAVASRTPSVVLFGPSDPARWGPLDRFRHRVLWAGPGGEIARIPVHRVVEESLDLVSR